MKTLDAIKKRRLLSSQVETIEFGLKQIKDEMKSLDDFIINGFIDEGVEGMTIDGVNTYIDSGLQYSCLKENREDKLFPWLSENSLEHLITTTVNAQSLNKAIREGVETGQINQIPEFIGQFGTKKIKEK